MTKPKNGKPKYKVGDWVSLVSGPHRLLALVVEHRGPLGRGGRHVYGLREFPLWAPMVESEASEDNLEPAERPEKLPEPHDALLASLVY